MDGLSQDAGIARKVGLIRQEVPNDLFLLIRVGGDAVVRQAISFEKVGDQHHGVQSRGQKICTLQGLTRKSEDIVDVDKPDAGARIASDV